MIRIEHVALWTEDVDRLAAFYAMYFGARAGDRYMNRAKGFESRFVSFGDGARLEIMRSTTLPLPARAAGAQQLGLVHVALSVGSEAAVDDLTARLHAAGHPVLDGPRRTGDGYYESVVLDPDGNRLEITA
jgi:lactoylglutathione lyase